MRIATIFRSLLVTGGVALGAIFFTAAPALAGSPIVYNQRGNYVPLTWAPRGDIGAIGWMKNSTWFRMSCWTDFQWYTGNYRSNRWFWGQSYYTGQWGYVHSSYVYYQVRVPRC